MRVLVVGGSGYVASLTLPTLARHHFLRLFDRRPPAETDLENVEGDVCDFDAVARAAEGMDALLYMAAGRFISVGESYADNVDALTSSLDANIKGLYMTLQASRHAGITHAVYTSSMSIYDGDLYDRYFPDEEMTPDARDIYGFTKRLGEEVCRNICRERGMTVNALRLCWPFPKERWLAETHLGTPTLATTGEDVAGAILAALKHRFGGFEAFMISGDYEQKRVNMAKAKRLLGWEPQARPAG